METSTGSIADFFHGFEGGAVYIGGRSFLHPLWKIADAEAFHAGVGVVVEFAGDALQVAGVGTGDSLQD